MLSILKIVVASLAICGTAWAQDTTAVVAEFGSDIVLEPADAWQTVFNDVCLSQDTYTTTVNATATLTFSGEHVQIYGVRNNASGRFSLQINESDPHMYNLRADHVQCELFVDLSLTQGTHNLTLRLEGQDTDYTVSEGGVSGQKPVLHLTNILYYTTTNGTASSIPAISTSPSVSHKGAIVGGVVGGVISITIILAALAYAKKKRTGPFTRGRHAFDPNRPTSTYITELSPRSPRSEHGFGDTKFALPYARMEDDDKGRDVKGNIDSLQGSAPTFRVETLAVPTLAYQAAPGGRGGRGLRKPVPQKAEDETEEV